MAKFPTRQNDILNFALQMIKGISRHRPDFPHLDFLIISRYHGARIAKIKSDKADSNLKLANRQKKLALQNLIKQMKVAIKQAQIDCRNTPAKLGYIGWSKRNTKMTVNKPAEPLNLQIEIVDNRIAKLSWQKNPASGSVRNYIIYSRNFSSDNPSWQMAAVAYDKTCEIKISDGLTEFTVAAVNTAGKSLPSNTVTARRAELIAVEAS